MYNLSLDKDRLSLYINGLDSSVRLMATQISNSPSAALTLKELLPRLIKINQEFDDLQKVVDEKDNKSS